VAVGRGQLSATEKPDVLVFELNGVILAAHVHSVLHGKADTLDIARHVVRRRLGLAGTSGLA
jgi:hypothetical protein